ncbi:unnamed protein product [Paramecium primaurelia]|uniref:Uncharacterized protein n=1 Tax=Paramecium primaurelia TaxID=5886 RepID=A0A8S1MJ33_PARPR|nr:unnamed protein product [Paramecium primaurelia]
MVEEKKWKFLLKLQLEKQLLQISNQKIQSAISRNKYQIRNESIMISIANFCRIKFIR